MNTHKRRVLCLLAAGIVILSLTVTGVFAWIDNNQHKTNVATGGNLQEKNDVVLVEDFEEPDDWTQGDELKKEVWVKNTGEGEIYVRLQLKEYMDIAKISYAYTSEYLLIDSDGKFVASTGTSAAELASFKLALTNMGLTYTDSQIKKFTAYGDAERYYLVTDANTNLNGKYGKQLMTNYTQDAARPLIESAKRGEYDPTPGHNNLECLYNPHLWSAAVCEDCEQGDDGEGNGFHDYVEWLLGAKIITLTDWIASGAEPAAVWILDDTSDEGWAYWGQALQPGASTDKLLEQIKLIKQPDGPFYYAIHVDMEAADLSQLTSNFTGMPQQIEDAYRGKTGLHITASRQTAAPGGTVNFKATWNGTDITADVTWPKPVNGTASGIGTLTKFNTPGVLTIGKQQPLGTILVNISYTPADGIARQASSTITVKPAA